MAWAVKQATRGSKEKFVLIMLANYAANESGECFPSLSEICEATMLSRDSVIRALKALEEDGLILVNKRRAGKVNLNNTYSLNLRGVVADSDQGSRTMRPGVVAPCDPNLSSKPINQPMGAREDEIFDEFEECVWADFPRSPTSRKAKALEAYRKLSRPERVACMRGVARYSIRFDDDQSDKRSMDERLRYVPHLSRWIEEKGWQAEIEAAA